VAGTYVSDCTTPPAPLACINADQLVTVNPTASGLHNLAINGQRTGPINCYERLSTFSVAGAMLVTELGSLPLSLLFTLECNPDDLGLQDAGP
jgi:hypothetical protein